MSLKMCSECGEEFQDHASNLTHWKDKHAGERISVRIAMFQLKNMFYLYRVAK
jgi:hypothetical protein